MPYFKFRRTVVQNAIIYVEEVAQGDFGKPLEEFSEIEYLAGLESGELVGEVVDIDYGDVRQWDYEGAAELKGAPKYRAGNTFWKRLTSKIPCEVLTRNIKADDC